MLVRKVIERVRVRQNVSKEIWSHLDKFHQNPTKHVGVKKTQHSPPFLKLREGLSQDTNLT